MYLYAQGKSSNSFENYGVLVYEIFYRVDRFSVSAKPDVLITIMEAAKLSETLVKIQGVNIISNVENIQFLSNFEVF